MVSTIKKFLMITIPNRLVDKAPLSNKIILVINTIIDQIIFSNIACVDDMRLTK